MARRAGVSTATVSRVLNTPDRVREETRARVDAAVAELGYTPHFGGRALASNRTNTVGAIIPTMENAIFAQGIQAMQDALSEEGVTLLVATSHYDAAREAAQVRTLLARGVDGLALIGHWRPDETYALLRQRRVPFVTMWSWAEGADHPFVGFDNRAAAAAMTERVLDYGHRQIALLAGVTKGNDRAAARLAGVQDALAAKGLRLVGDPIELRYDLEESAAAAARLLSRDQRPSVLICGNDVIATGALIGVRRLGLRVPQDVSVVGFDDIDLARAVDPPLTTVHVPHRRMGRAAAAMLCAMASGAEAPAPRLFDFELLERGSLGPAYAAVS